MTESMKSECWRAFRRVCVLGWGGVRCGMLYPALPWSFDLTFLPVRTVQHKCLVCIVYRERQDQFVGKYHPSSACLVLQQSCCFFWI